MSISKDILSTLTYFDIFNYPLTPIEIYQFLQNKYEYDTFQDGLEGLINNGFIYKLEDFYSLKKDYSLVTRRKKGNLNAKRLLEISVKVAGILYYFPFVRGIAVSGSISKNFADENSDIDLFIITRKNRLWIARSIMHFFKKLTFLVKKEQYFCMNYFVDEARLTIEEKNIFTATEIITLIPLKGIHAFRDFNGQNTWVKSFLPNHSMKISYLKETKHPFIKKLIEVLFNNIIGNKLELLLMNITKKRWDKKTNKGKVNNNGVLMGMKTNRHYSKPDPANFQNKFVLQYEGRIENLLQEMKKAAP